MPVTDTASVARAFIQHNLQAQPAPLRLFYIGPQFRYERPQRGRYRQFHQIGVETFGMAGPDIDAELLLLTQRLWRRLGIEGLELQINSLGTPAVRTAYRDELVAYFSAHHAQLDEDSRRRLQSNPLRILDSKNPELQDLIAGAPQLTAALDDESRAHFAGLCERLDAAGLAYRVNPRLVRGLDYYTKTVFEWVSDRLGAQATVCAGGRYDGLVAQLGGRATPAAGFAMGVERLVALLEEQAAAAPGGAPDVYLAVMGDQAERLGLVWAEQLRDACPDLRVQLNCGGGGFKAQLKRADKSGAALALVLGEDEAAQGGVSVKPLREDTQQSLWSWPELLQTVSGRAAVDVPRLLTRNH